jgi:hypothetical protein
LERRHRHACQRARDFQLETRYLLSGSSAPRRL